MCLFWKKKNKKTTKKNLLQRCWKTTWQINENDTNLKTLDLDFFYFCFLYVQPSAVLRQFNVLISFRISKNKQTNKQKQK